MRRVLDSEVTSVESLLKAYKAFNSWSENDLKFALDKKQLFIVGNFDLIPIPLNNSLNFS